MNSFAVDPIVIVIRKEILVLLQVRSTLPGRHPLLQSAAAETEVEAKAKQCTVEKKEVIE
jgi:hypothetical protein